jgi:hypothetical protein
MGNCRQSLVSTGRIRPLLFSEDLEEGCVVGKVEARTALILHNYQVPSKK